MYFPKYSKTSCSALMAWPLRMLDISIRHKSFSAGCLVKFIWFSKCWNLKSAALNSARKSSFISKFVRCCIFDNGVG